MMFSMIFSDLKYVYVFPLVFITIHNVLSQYYWDGKGGQWYVCETGEYFDGHFDAFFGIMIWVNYNELTTSSLKIMVYFRGIIPKWP